MNNKEIAYAIIKDHIIEILKTLEKNRYINSKLTLKINDNKRLINNMFHENTIYIMNKLLENILNYLHHTINNKMDDVLNDIFNEIRLNILIHNSCLIQKYVDIIKLIYNNISINEFDYSSVDEYLDSFECQCKLILKLNKIDILSSLNDCDIECKMVYDPEINPIQIN
jgi:hypothetical protein